MTPSTDSGSAPIRVSTPVDGLYFLDPMDSKINGLMVRIEIRTPSGRSETTISLTANRLRSAPLVEKPIVTNRVADCLGIDTIYQSGTRIERLRKERTRLETEAAQTRERLTAQQQRLRTQYKRYHILTETEFVMKITDWTIDGKLFTGRLPRMPRGRPLSLYDIFWTHGRFPSDYLYVFHGTDALSRRDFQARGPRADVATRIAYGNGFYLTTDPEEAVTYAHSRYNQRYPRGGCMSPIVLVYRIPKEKARSWTGDGSVFNLKPDNPIYIIVRDQQKLDQDLEYVETLFLEERCFRR